MAVLTLQRDDATEGYVRRLRKRLHRAVFTLLATVLLSTLGLVVLGRHGNEAIEQRFLLAFWDTLNLVSTVGNIAEDFTIAQRLWAIGVIIFGLGAVLYGFGVIQGLLHGGEIAEVYARRRMQKSLNQVSGHVVICGYGNVGRSVAQMLTRAGETFAIIERDPARAEIADRDGHPVVQADATDELALREVGIDRATGLLATLNSDEANVYLCLIARELQSTIRIVARAGRTETRSTLQRAGADRVIVPGELVGMQMSHLLLKPKVSEFIAAAVGEGEYDFAEISVGLQKSLRGKTLGELRLPERVGALVISVIDNAGQQTFNPPEDRVLTEDDTLLVVCREGAIDALAAL